MYVSISILYYQGIYRSANGKLFLMIKWGNVLWVKNLSLMMQGKLLYSFNHLLYSDLSTIYFPSSLNKLKLFLSPSSDCSNKNHVTRKKKTFRKKLSCFLRQDNLPLGLTDVIFLLVYFQVMSHVAFPCLPSQMAE